MDDRAAHWLCDHLYRISLFVGRVRAYALFRAQLPRADHRGAAAERQSGGSCRRVWRRGQPDGFWAARRGDHSFTGDHVVRGDVHGLRAGDGGEGGSRTGNSGRQLDPREIFEACACQDDSDSGSDTDARNAGSRGAAVFRTRAVAAGARGSNQAVIWFRAVVPPITFPRLAGFLWRGYNEVLTSVRSWRNWQTHQLEGLAVAIPWWFESTRPHQISYKNFLPAGFELLEAPAMILEWHCSSRKSKPASSARWSKKKAPRPSITRSP